MNLGILVGSCLFSLLIAEVAVRMFIPVRDVGPSFSVYDPIYGKRLKRNFHCVRESPEFSMQFSTNSYGFRGEEPASFPSEPVLFLGDSFTAGYGVNDGEEFPAVVQSLLRSTTQTMAIPVVNAGSGNIGNGYWVKFLRTEARLYQPRLVVIQMCSNDFGDNITDALFTLDSLGNMIEQPGPAPRQAGRWLQPIAEDIPGLSSSHLFALIRQVLTASSYEPARDSLSEQQAPGPCEDLTVAIVHTALDECRRNRWPVLAILADMGGRRRVLLDSVFHSLNVECLNIPTKEERPELYFSIDGHWNARGHRYVAQRVYDAILHRTDQNAPSMFPEPRASLRIDGVSPTAASMTAVPMASVQ